MPQHPHCSARLRDGSSCDRVTATPSSPYCSHHTEQFGPEALPRKTAPRNAPKKRIAVAVVEPTPEIALVEASGNGASGDPTAIRPALAQLAADNLTDIQRALLDAALSATTTKWATVMCSGCQAKSRVELPVPDVRARLQAIEMLLAQGIGRAPTAPEVMTSILPRTAAEVEKMSWRDMQAVFAALYVDEIAAVQRDGGTALVREKLAGLSEGGRRVLREALAAVETPASAG